MVKRTALLYAFGILCLGIIVGMKYLFAPAPITAADSKKDASLGCKEVPKGFVDMWDTNDDRRAGMLFAIQLAGKLMLEDPSERHVAYDAIYRQTNTLGYHGEAGYESYPYVFCGSSMDKIHRHVAIDALYGEDEISRAGARLLMREIMSPEDRLMIFEGLLRTGTRESDLIPAMKYWLELKLAQYDTPSSASATVDEENKRLEANRARQKEDAPEMIAEFEQKFMPRFEHGFLSVNVAFHFYKERFATHDCTFCPIYGEDSAINLYFLSPDTEEIPNVVRTGKWIEIVDTQPAQRIGYPADTQ